MDAGRLVVNRVVAIVEQHLVDQTGEIASMVELRFFIGMDMLHVVEDQHAEERDLMRDDDEQEGILPVPEERHGVVKAENKVLGSGEMELGAIAAPEGFEIGGNGLLLKITADGGVAEQGENIILLAEAVGKGVIALLIIQQVVIFVVGGDPTEGREAIEQGQPVVGRNVQKSRSPHGYVIMIVSDDGHGNGHEQIPKIEEGLEAREVPLDDEQCGGNAHVQESAAISLVGEQQDELNGSTFGGQ